MANGGYRIGIDVGGTFTHGVVLNPHREVVATACVPTTHRAKFGVAEGVVQTLELLLKDVRAEDVDIVAHSTTQATNAILEGDVASVCLIPIVPAANRAIATAILGEKFIELGESSRINLCGLVLTHDELPLSQTKGDEVIGKLGDAPVIALVESLGTDDPTGEYESQVAEYLTLKGIVRAKANAKNDETNRDDNTNLAGDTKRYIVKASDLSARLGLKLRAKTAVINAAMIPKVVETARFTSDAVKSVLPNARLLVIKSDGGVMDAYEMEERPLNCVLSGPAAGASAAIHVSRISDGVFLEVGGTSTDISLISAGRVRKRAASLGGHVLHLRSLDLRTVGVGGGSLLWIDKRGKPRCGPRSAHILGLKYLSFPTAAADTNGEMKPVNANSSGNFNDIEVDTKSNAPFLSVKISGDLSGDSYGITLTDAANYLKLIPMDDGAYSEHEFIRSGFEAVGKTIGRNPEAVARSMMDECSERVITAVRELIVENEARVDDLVIVGGGGGVYSVAEEVAKALGRPFEVSPYPAVISAVGAAAAVSTFSHEVFSANPDESEMRKLRTLAVTEMEKLGVARDQMRISFEYDARQKLLRVEGEGTLGFEHTEALVSESELVERARHIGGLTKAAHTVIYSKGSTFAVEFAVKSRGIFGGEAKKLVCMDKFGRSLLTVTDVQITRLNADEFIADIESLLTANTRYTDGGESAPDLFLLTESQLMNFASFSENSQALAAIGARKDEIKGECLVIIRKKK